MQEIVAGILMSFDVVALYLIATNVKAKWLLALWTAFLHMISPIDRLPIWGVACRLFNKLGDKPFDTVIIFRWAAITAVKER